MKYSQNLGGVIRLLDWIYPPGTIKEFNIDLDPNELYTWMTWERYAQGRSLVGVDENDADFEAAGLTGGEKGHQLTASEMPVHRHNFMRQQWYSSDPIVSSGSGSIYSWKSSAGGTTSPGYRGLVDAMGEDEPHNTMHPYITAYIWVRIK